MARIRPATLPAPLFFPRQQRRARRPSGALSFDAFVSRVYLPYVKTRKRSWRVDERITRQYLSPVFGDRFFDVFSRAGVEAWLQSLLSRGLAPATCNRIFAVFKSVCSLAAVHGFFPAGQSPCAGVSSFRTHTQRERCLSRIEARRLMRALERSARPEAFVLRLLLLTGARKSEILRLRREHIRLDLRLLTVPLSKSGKPRHILLSEEAVYVIRAIPRTVESPWLFPGHSPEKPLSDIYLFWNALRRSLGLGDVRIHDLRHTFASFLVNAGHSLYEVQKLLGHSDPRTTMRYAHLGQPSLLIATETVSALLENAGRKPFRENRPPLSPPDGGSGQRRHGQGRERGRKVGEVGLTSSPA